MKKRYFLKTTLVAGLAAAALSTSALAANPVLKIGFVGVTSGPAAAWGISNQRSMETRAAWINETGGVKIGGTTYNVEIVAFDDQKDPKRAIAGMEKMAQEGIHYVVGPNVDDGAAAVRPVAEQKGIMYFPYAFPKELYTKPASNAVLGMVANYQSGPAIYKHLMKNNGVKSVAFVAANESDPLSQRDGGVEAAKALGIRIYTIGAGTEGEAPFPLQNAFGRTIYRNVLVKFDEKTLSEIASITNGQYFRATDTNSLRKIFSEIDKMEKTKIEVERTAQYRDLFQYVLIPGIACLLLEILLSQTVWRRLP